ncbi:MAG: N-acetylmuramoyl-L-alanine amidase [Vicingaceae bacterium]
MRQKAFLLTILALFSIPFNGISQSQEDFFGKLKTVVIDAGHGGKDKGCLGASSHEKDIALSIALKLGGYLEEKFDNLNVIYTRKTDVFLELDERAKIANTNHADLFICIHANAASPSAFGTETFVMGNAKTDANLKAAQRENAAILLEDNYEERYENFNPNSPESYIAMTIMQSAFQGQSIHFAELVQAQFRERVGRKDRGVKMAPFWVLHQTTMPSVLIETGFLTNANEEKFLMSDIGQDYMASAIYRAFKEYKEEVEAKSQAIVKDEVIEDKENTTEAESALGRKAQRLKKEGLIFKVQLATTTNKVDPDPANFKGLQGVSYYEAGGLFRYTIGEEPSWSQASKLQTKAQSHGFNDAFIIAFYEGKRIAVGEAVKLLKQDK